MCFMVSFRISNIIINYFTFEVHFYKKINHSTKADLIDC